MEFGNVPAAKLALNSSATYVSRARSTAAPQEACEKLANALEKTNTAIYNLLPEVGRNQAAVDGFICQHKPKSGI